MRRVIGIALGISVIAVLVWLLFFKASSSPDDGGPGKGRGRRGGGQDGPVPVAIADLTRRDVPIYLDGLGTVQAFNTVTVRPQVDGQLVSVAFTEGQEVKAGDVLAQIDARSFQTTLDQALAKKVQDESLLKTAKQDLQRYLDLVNDGYVSKQQTDTQRQTVAQAEATLKSDDAVIQNARISVGYARVTSPISGVTGLRLVDVGNLVTASTTTGLVVVTQIKPISVVFTLPEQSLADIRDAGGGQGLKVIALDRDNQKELSTGELTVVDNQIDQTTGTIKLKATFANDDKALWPGQFINVRLLVRTEKNGIVVPSSAVQRGPDSDFIYIAKPDSTAEKRDVTVALTEDGSALIAKGLNDGDRIITDGQYRLQPGSKIRQAGADEAVADAAGGEAADGKKAAPDDKRQQRRRKADGATPSDPSAQPSPAPAPAQPPQ